MTPAPQRSEIASRRRRLAWRRRGSWCVVLASLLAGCADGGELRAKGDAEVMRRLLAPGENGLQIRTWRVAERPQTIAAALAANADDLEIDPDVARRLERNGLRLARVPLERLDALRRDLGGTMLDLDGWHGQAPEWRDLVDREVGDEPRALAVDGRVRLFRGGEMRLMMRGWTMLMEDGPHMYVELRPEHDRSYRTQLDQMLGRRTFDGERFDALAVEVLLERGYAYVLTCETPGIAWAPPRPAVAQAETAPDSGREVPDAPGARASSASGLGPDALPPLTIGELLLRSPRTADPALPDGAVASIRTAPAEEHRDLVLIVPQIPLALYPPDHPMLAGASTPAHGDDSGKVGP
jgi:hypothetical protein